MAVTTSASLVGLALIAAACSDVSNPTAVRAPGAAAFTIGPTANPAGATIISFISNGSTQYCSSADQVHNYTVPATLAPIAGCGGAFDLESNLINTYNPGWSQPSNGADWIGPNATSNEYRTHPGSYVFQTQFNLPANVTSPVLNDTLLSDNAIAVFLNGHLVNTQVITDCVGSPCNWVKSYIVSDANAADFVIGGTNTLSVFLVDTPNGGTPGNNYACVLQPQVSGTTGFSGGPVVTTVPNHVYSGYNSATYATTGDCQNPGGVAFWGTVAYVPPAITTWCSPGFWKNHEELWTAFLGVKYASIGSWRAPLSSKAGAGADPTLQQVVENPQIYGGPATNSVADYLSNKFFGTKIGSGVESCPDPSLVKLPTA